CPASSSSRFGLRPRFSGVFLVTAVVAFLRERPYQTAAFTALAPIIHPTYLLPAGLFTAAFISVLLYQRRLRQALLIGGFPPLLRFSPIFFTPLPLSPTR